MAVAFDEETMQELYTWVDTIPLSRPKRNIARDFSDGVLTAELVKFYFPKLVEMHNYVPANSTTQKLSNWTILNRKVLSKLSFSVPDDVIRKIVQCSPGVVELVLNTLRQKIEEKQRLHHISADLSQDQATQNNGNTHADKGYKSNGTELSPRQGARVDPASKTHQGYAQAANADTTLRFQLAEKEQTLILSQETIQILQAKLRRLEQLLLLKNVRIDDLTRRLQELEKK